MPLFKENVAVITEFPLTIRQSLDIADQFAQAGARALDLWLEKRASLTDREARTLEQCEDRIGKVVTVFRSSGIGFMEATVDELVHMILKAIYAAQCAMEKAVNLERAAVIAEALAQLAGAVLTKQGTHICTSAKILLALTRIKAAQ